MKKYLGYIPAILFSVFYLSIGMTGASLALSMDLLWLAGFFITVGYYRSGRWMRRGSLADQVISAPKS